MYTVSRCNYLCVKVGGGGKWHNTEGQAEHSTKGVCIRCVSHLLPLNVSVTYSATSELKRALFYSSGWEALSQGNMTKPMDIQTWNLGQASFSCLGKSAHILLFIREIFWIYPHLLVGRNYLLSKDLRWGLTGNIGMATMEQMLWPYPFQRFMNSQLCHGRLLFNNMPCIKWCQHLFFSYPCFLYIYSQVGVGIIASRIIFGEKLCADSPISHKHFH